jgi:hypothetical protein
LGYDLIFGPDGARVTWNSGAIPIVVRMDDSTTLDDGSTFSSTVFAAMAAWNERIERVQLVGEKASAGQAGDANGINEVAFDSKIYSNAPGGGRDFGPNVLAVTISYRAQSPRGDGSYERTQSDILFNTAWSWDAYRRELRSTVDLRRVAIHEFGHVLGLNHPNEAGQSVTAIMNSTVSATDWVEADDITGAQWLYGRPGGFSPPANDGFSDATLFSGNNVTVAGSSVGATKEPGEPNHAPGKAGGASIWWKWVATANGTITVTTAGSEYDTLLAAYTGNSVAALNQLAANDDVNPGVVRTSTVTLRVLAGTTYYFAVDGWQGLWGAAQLNLAFQNDPAPVVTVSPFSQTVNDGRDVNFSVTAPLAVAFNWQRLASGASVWADIANGNAYSGQGTSTLVVRADFAMNGDQFRCVVSNLGGSATSASAALTVLPTMPYFESSLRSQTVADGGEATFVLDVRGTAPITLQWSHEGVPIPGANGTTLRLSNVQRFQSGTYRVQASNAFGTASSEAQLAVGLPPVITAQPGSLSVELGQRATFYVGALAVGDVSYRWYRDGNLVASTVRNTLELAAVSAADAGTYYVVVSNPAGSVASDSVQLQVVPYAPATFDFQPESTTVLLGAEAAFSVSVSSRSPVRCQWLLNGEEIPGATGFYYSVRQVRMSDVGEYRVRVTNAGGPVLSAPALLRVRTSPPPRSMPIYLRPGDGIATLSVEPDSTSVGPYTYQWYRNGELIPGATDALLEVSRLSNEFFGEYFAVVGNASGATVSQTRSVGPASVTTANAWTAELEHDGVVYFALQKPSRLARFDLTTAQWLPDVDLPDQVSSLAPDEGGGIFLLANRAIYRFVPSRGLEVFSHIVFGVGSLESSGRFLFLTRNQTIHVLDRETGKMISSTGASSLFDSIGGGSPRFHSQSRRLVSFGDSTIWCTRINSDGIITDAVVERDGGAFLRKLFFSGDGAKVISNLGYIWSSETLARVGATTPFDDLVDHEGTVYTVAQGVLRRLDASYREVGCAYFPVGAVKLAIRGSIAFGFAHPETPGTRPSVQQLSLQDIREPAMPSARLAPAGPVLAPQVFSDESGVIYVYSKLDRQVYRWSTAERRYLPSIPLRFWPDLVTLLPSQGGVVYSRGEQVRRSGIGPQGDLPFAAAPRPISGLRRVGEAVWAVAGEYFYLWRWNGDSILVERINLGDYAQPQWLPLSGGMIFTSRQSSDRGYIVTEALDDSGGRADGKLSVFLTRNLGGTLRVSPEADRIVTDSGHYLDMVAEKVLGPRWNVDFKEVAWKSDAVFALVADLDGSALLQRRRRSDGVVLAESKFSGAPGSLATLPDGNLALLTFESEFPVFRVLDPGTLASVPADESLRIVRGPQDLVALAGQTVALQVEISSPSPASFQWFKNGVAIPSATQRELVLTNVGAGDVGNYSVEATANGVLVRSAGAQLYVQRPPVITEHPVDYGGEAGVFAVGVEGDGPLSYRWIGNGSVWARTPTFVRPASNPRMRVRVEVRNRAGIAISRPALLDQMMAPTAQLFGGSANSAEGGLIMLSASPGNQFFVTSYQWQRDGVDLPGQVGPVLTIDRSRTADSGTYTVRLATPFGSTVSAPIEVRVFPVTPIVDHDLGVYLRADGTLWVNGRIRGAEGRALRPLLAARDVVEFAVANEYLYWLQRDGSVRMLGKAEPLESNAVRLLKAATGLGIVKRDGSAWDGDFIYDGSVRFVRRLDRVREIFPNGFAVRQDGNLWAWGPNSAGEAGTGTAGTLSAPVQVMSGVRDVISGPGFTYFLREDGRVFGAGSNTNRQFGENDGPGPIWIADNVRKVLVAASSGFLLKENNELWRIGYAANYWISEPGTPLLRRVASDIEDFDVNRSNALLITTAGSLLAIGSNYYQELGPVIGSQTDPYRLTLETVRSAGFGTYFLTRDGRLFSLGVPIVDDRSELEIARGPVTPQAAPTEVRTTRSGAEVTVTWSPLPGASYEILRRRATDRADALAVVGRTKMHGIYVDSVPDEAEYVYGVRAVSLLGTSATTVAGPPEITTAPQSARVTVGAAISFTVELAGPGPFTFQWLKDGVELTGRTSATLALDAVTLLDAGVYRVRVTNAVGSVTSAPATLDVDKLVDEITFPSLADRAFTALPISLAASARSGLPITFGVVNGPASVSGSTLRLFGSGEVRVRATTAGDATYLAAPPVERVFQISPNLDLWLVERFDATELTVPSITGLTADPDGDSLPNLLEYAFDLDPRSASAMPGTISATATEWTFTYNRPPGRADVSVAVEFSPNLVDWGSSSVVLTRVALAADGVETWQASVSRSGPTGFFRLKVSR